jgi:transposase
MLVHWHETVSHFLPDGLANADMEGANNQIRSLVWRAFGYVDFSALRLRMLTECGFDPY